MSRAAVPRTPPPPEPDPVRRYEVLSRRCVWGKRGEIIERAFKPGVELSLIQAGVLKHAPAPENKARPLKSADKEG